LAVPADKLPALDKNFTISVNDKKIWEGGKLISANNKISYDSKSGGFIVFEFQAGSYEINAVDNFKLK
jgi:hypothetical protein